MLGAIFTTCTVIGNPLSRYGTGKVAAWGHLILAFGADVKKAQNRIAELLSNYSGG